MNKLGIIIAGIAIAFGLIGYSVYSKQNSSNQIAGNDIDGTHIKTDDDLREDKSSGVQVRQKADGTLYFATKDGMSLYVSSNDEFSKSNCVGDCLMQWKPFYSADLSVSDGFTSIEREDQAKQSAHIERPLYTYVNDKKPGDILGDGIDGVWSLVGFGK